MSTSDGQVANAATFNAAYVSKTADSSVASSLELASSATAEGSTITKVQRELNSLNSFAGKTINTAKDVTPTWSTNNLGSSTDSLFTRTNLADAEVGNLRTNLGTAVSATSLGTFTGTTIADNVSVKTALQSLETAVEAVSAGGLLPITSKVANYTATTSDYIINCSGAAFTITLPAASGNSGKVFIIRKTDATLANIITIDGNASETINGALTTTLNTLNESVSIVCDGSNWLVINRRIPETLPSWTPTISNFGTVTSSGAVSWRRGRYLEAQVYFTSGTVVGTVASISLPSGLNIDTTTDQGIVRGNTTAAAGQIVGQYGFSAASQNGSIITATGTSTSLVYFGAATGSSNFLIAQTGSVVTNSSTAGAIRFSVPISGWN
jgi:hypothetical protein